MEITNRTFEFPKDYDFEKVFNESFGIIKGEPFPVRLEFSGWAASYVSERIFSPDQTVKWRDDGKLEMAFSASSKSELKGWILWFGPGAKVIEPDWLVDELLDMAVKIQDNYVQD